MFKRINKMIQFKKISDEYLASAKILLKELELETDNINFICTIEKGEHLSIR